MAKATIASIQTLSDKLHNRWNREFAGKPRHTRNLAELEKMVEKAAALAKKSKGIPGEKGDALEKVVVERWKLYRTERDAIAEVKYERPEVAEIHALGLKIDRVLALWRRHYAGRDRRTRDLVRLDDMIKTMATTLPRLEALSASPEVKKESLEGLRGQLEVYKDERSEIDKQRRAADPLQRAASVAAEAQSALDQYRVHFAGQPRATCTPALLERLIRMLEHALAELATITPSDASATEVHDRNVTVLTTHLATWRSELPLLVAARESIETRDLTNQLGAVANQLFAIYQRDFAGKERASRNLQLLSDVCDRLTEIADMMATLDGSTEEAINRKNLPVVDERLRRYETEWSEIAKAKAAVAATTGAAGKTGTGTAGAAKAPVALPGITIAKKA